MSTFKQNLVKARSAIIFLIGLTLAFWLVYSLETWNPSTGSMAVSELITEEYSVPSKQVLRELSEQELQWANIAWQYFENNYVEETGLVNSVDEYPASTMWDISSYLLGLIAAHRLNIVDAENFDNRVSGLLDTLSTMPLFEKTLPNKSYNTQSVAMVTYDNDETERGIGWSAIDVGRIMVPLNVLVWRYPEHTEKVNKVLAHWQLDAVVMNSEMYGTEVDENDETQLVQEGRLGYEEYAAKSLALVSMDVSRALDYELHTEMVDFYGVDVATDGRKPSEFVALNYVVSEPYILDGLEFGFDRFSKELMARLYKVQQLRYEKTGILTAVSEDNIDKAPYFVYNTVFADGKKWNAVTGSGEDAEAFKSVSTKAVLGFHALFNDEYSNKLIKHIENNYDENRGWYSGIYEQSGEPNTAITANTNGIILEAMHYIQFGPIAALKPPSATQLAEGVEEQ